jgi:two-component system heavy metal sensor histidine kinase CusS
MSSKPAKPRSIASQLVFLFTPAAALLLFCSLGIFYVIVVRHAFEEDNAVLADKVSALRLTLRNPGGLQTLSEELKIARLGERPVYWVRVTNRSGHTIIETPGMDTRLPPDVFGAAPSSSASISTPKDYRSGDKLFSLVSTAERVAGEPYTIEVAQDRSSDEQFEKEFGALLAIVLALGVFASAGIALTVAKRGLRPLAQLTRSLKRVRPTRLHERVPPTEWPRELQPVAAAFDDMLDRLEDSFTRLSQFSADLAHELRTPVANILGEAEVALTRPRTPDEYREVIESSVAECQRLSGIIDNLLFLARAEAGREAIMQTSIDARAEIEKIASFYQAIADEQKIDITCAGEGQINADPTLFGRALSNLVENALRYTPANGKISVSIAKRDGQTEISVTDTGCGIPPEHIARVFDRFYRVDSSRSAQGNGLGLALVKSIVDLHGGSAVVESEVGRGTTVTLTFPA